MVAELPQKKAPTMPGGAGRVAWTADRLCSGKQKMRRAQKEAAMHTRRFGRKLKLPSTVAIKHEILKMLVQDELKALALAAKADEGLDLSRQWRRGGAKTSASLT